MKWLLDTLETYSVHGKAVARNAHADGKGFAQVITIHRTLPSIIDRVRV